MAKPIFSSMRQLVAMLGALILEDDWAVTQSRAQAWLEPMEDPLHVNIKTLDDLSM